MLQGALQEAAVLVEAVAALPEWEVVARHREVLSTMVLEAGALVVLRLQRLAMSPVPVKLSHSLVWSIGIYTEKKEADEEIGNTTTVAVGRHTLRNHTIHHHRDWRVRQHGRHAPAVAQDPAVAPPALTPSAAPAVVAVAGKCSEAFWCISAYLWQ